VTGAAKTGVLGDVIVAVVAAVTVTVVVTVDCPAGFSAHQPVAVTVSVPIEPGVRMNCPAVAGSTVVTPNPPPEYWYFILTVQSTGFVAEREKVTGLPTTTDDGFAVSVSAGRPGRTGTVTVTLDAVEYFQSSIDPMHLPRAITTSGLTSRGFKMKVRTAVVPGSDCQPRSIPAPET